MWKWKKYLVKKIDRNNTKTIYTIEDENKKEYTFILKFYDLENEIKVGDIFKITDELLSILSEVPNITFYFGPMNTNYSKKLNMKHEYEKFIIVQDNKEIIYQRYYG